MSAIPAIIHQTWKNSSIPEEYQSCVDSVRANNPDYEYVLWTDEMNRNFINTHYPWFIPTYDGYRHAIERADTIRYFILYTYGGIYIDLDMECLKPIDHLLECADVFFSLEAGPRISQNVISNAFMACGPGHPFFLDIIRQLDHNTREDITFSDVFNITGPDMVTKMYQQFYRKYKIQIISLNEICPKGVLSQHPRFTSMSLQKIRQDKTLTMIHHNTESWNIQLKCPDIEIEGYVLFKYQDIIGNDIDYVEYTSHSHAEILHACESSHQAIGFNYNGYIKGVGGKLQPVNQNSSWLKDGIVPWIYVKSSFVNLVS